MAESVSPSVVSLLQKYSKCSCDEQLVRTESSMFTISCTSGDDEVAALADEMSFPMRAALPSASDSSILDELDTANATAPMMPCLQRNAKKDTDKDRVM